MRKLNINPLIFCCIEINIKKLKIYSYNVCEKRGYIHLVNYDVFLKFYNTFLNYDNFSFLNSIIILFYNISSQSMLSHAKCL